MARNFVSGSSQYIEFPSITLGTSYTVACRFKVSTAGVAHSLIAQRSTITANIALFDLEIQASNLMRFFVFGDASEFANMTATAPVLNQWHTLVGRRNGNDFNLFRDGVDAASTTETMGAITADSLNVGAVVQASTTRVSFLNGDIAECAIWNVNLTDAEILAYHNGVSPFLIRPLNLFRYYPLYGTTQEADLSGSGDVGTNNGSTASGFHSPSGQYKKRSVYLQPSTVGLGFCVRGIVQENGVNVARTVRVYLSSTGALLGETVSNSSTGEYTICNIPTASSVFVIAFDDAGGQSFNAQIFDKVVPLE